MARLVRQILSGFTAWRATTLGPLQFPMFRGLWLATMISYFGSVIQTVGAAWHMTSLGVSAAWVAQVQAAAMLPIVLFAMPAGALADIGDRRVLMLAAQVFGAVASFCLVASAWFGALNPPILLLFTLLVGSGSALAQPSWQASVGDLVDREKLPAAIGLNALAYNAARGFGPALGGAIVAAVGAVGAFAVNAFSYVGLISVLASWRAPHRTETLPPESIGRAMVSGVRYAMLSPQLLAIYTRGGFFGLCASSLLALLPLVARDRLGGGPVTYGVCLAGFGVGSMMAALVAARIRQLVKSQRLVGLCTIAYGLMTISLSVNSLLPLTAVALVVAGGAWILVLATISICVQLSCPRWVVGRCVAMGQVATFGGVCVGSALWGGVAAQGGLAAALIVSGSALLGSLLLARHAPIPDTDTTHDWSVDPAYKVPAPAAPIDPRAGPIVVMVEYRIPREHAATFLQAIHDASRFRRRDGVQRWSIAQDLDDPEIWRETYQSPTWIEHVRRVGRMTAADQLFRERVLKLHRGPPPVIRRMLERPQGASPTGED